MESSPLEVSRRPLLSVVVVNYRSWPDVVALVGSLADEPEIRSGDCEVVVIDNGSPEPAPPRLIDAPPVGVRVLLQGANLGFSAGVNAGRRASSAGWLLVLNPDVVPDPGLLAGILGRIREYEARIGRAPGVVGFGLRNPDGSRQPSVGAFPNLLRTAWEQLIPRPRRKYQPEWRLRPGPVDWVTGACLLLNAAMLDDVGGMDEDFFLYHEEVALCRVALDRGWTVEYDPGVSVVHLRPLQNRAISPKMRVITRHSKLLYFRKHLPRRQFLALGVIVRLEAEVRAAWCGARGLAQEARGWRAIADVSRRLARGEDLGGPGVLELAEAATGPTDRDDADAT
ncbi:glycosyltransferase [Tundrisphaera sp. TA3]|uniref:glycosyltransferase n=1 Tax=Tundrisphaera sp. TA3 TaxID=3435775 RepID=UPI003EBB1299